MNELGLTMARSMNQSSQYSPRRSFARAQNRSITTTIATLVRNQLRPTMTWFSCFVMIMLGGIAAGDDPGVPSPSLPEPPAPPPEDMIGLNSYSVVRRWLIGAQIDVTSCCYPLRTLYSL